MDGDLFPDGFFGVDHQAAQGRHDLGGRIVQREVALASGECENARYPCRRERVSHCPAESRHQHLLSRLKRYGDKNDLDVIARKYIRHTRLRMKIACDLPKTNGRVCANAALEFKSEMGHS